MKDLRNILNSILRNIMKIGTKKLMTVRLDSNKNQISSTHHHSWPIYLIWEHKNLNSLHYMAAAVTVYAFELTPKKKQKKSMIIIKWQSITFDVAIFSKMLNLLWNFMHSLRPKNAIEERRMQPEVNWMHAISNDKLTEENSIEFYRIPLLWRCLFIASLFYTLVGAEFST